MVEIAAATHPARDVILAHHPVERYGCTVCHAGQGVALTAKTAHGDLHLFDQTPRLAEPLLTDTERILAAYRDAGLRVAYSVAMKEQNRVVYGDDETFLATLPRSLADALGGRLRSGMSGDQYLTLFEEMHRRHAAAGGDRLRLLLSPSNVQWISDHLFQRIKDAARRYRTGIHMHLSETAYQRAYASGRSARRPSPICMTSASWAPSCPVPTACGCPTRISSGWPMPAP